MKLSQFKHEVMQWSIYMPSAMDNLPKYGTDKQWREAYDAIDLDLSTNAPDGNHPFVFDGGVPGRCHGCIVVKDGQFDAMATAEAIHQASLAEKESPGYNEMLGHVVPYHHRFIEDLTWDPETELFTVGLGS